MDYFVYQDVLTESLIQEILSAVKKKKLYEGKVGYKINYKKKIRYDLFMNEKEKEILSKIDNIVYNRVYKSILNKFNKNIKYREQWKVGKYVSDRKGFYDYHRDDVYETKYRNISCVLALSEPDDYQGGELHFKELGIKFKLKKNSMIFFKSSLLHGVTPVTSGERYVLIGFMFDDDGKIIKEKIDKNFKCKFESYIPMLNNSVLDYYNIVNNNFLDKDYADYYRNIYWSDEDDYIIEDNNSDTLLVTFAGMGMKKSLPTFIFYNFLKKYKDIDKLFMRDIKQRYYMTGLINSTSNLENTIDLIKKIISRKKYKRIVGLGCSAGGFAAILFSQLLNFDKVIAFSPQVVINKKKDTIIKDIYNAPNTCNWLSSLNKNNSFYQKCLDLANFKPFKCEIEIHYASRANKGIDKTHAEYLKDNNCFIVEHNSNKHMIALELRDNGKLKCIIDDLLLKSNTSLEIESYNSKENSNFKNDETSLDKISDTQELNSNLTNDEISNDEISIEQESNNQVSSNEISDDEIQSNKSIDNIQKNDNQCNKTDSGLINNINNENRIDISKQNDRTVLYQKLESLLKSDLVNLCKNYKITTTGNKSKLIERLIEYIEKNSDTN